MTSLDEKTPGYDQQFSVVSFSTEVLTVHPLENAATASENTMKLVYRGGWTNTGDALKACFDTLKDSYKERVILVITDGVATAGHDLYNITGKAADDKEHHEYAIGQADLARKARMTVIPVSIGDSTSFNKDKLMEIASGYTMFLDVDNFDALTDSDGLVDQLLEKVKCGSSQGFIDGKWEPVNFEDFTNYVEGDSLWSFRGGAARVNDEGVTTLPHAFLNNYAQFCPYSTGATDYCALLLGDTIEDEHNMMENMGYVISSPVTVGSTVIYIRLKFDYLVHFWLTDEYHIHVDYSTDGGLTWSIHQYSLGSHMNNYVDGHIEQWLTVGIGTDFDIDLNVTSTVQWRFHQDAFEVGNQQWPVAAVDNIKVEQYVPP